MMRVFGDVLDKLEPEQRAISLASHNGTPEHVAAAQSILKREEWGMMQTPLDVPLVQFGRQVRRPRRWYHCCSGEHAAIVAEAVERKDGQGLATRCPHIRSSKVTWQNFSPFLGEDWEPKRVARDGCGLPTVSNTVSELALCMASLVQRRDEEWIWNAMVKYPDLIGGFNRVDSTIIKAGGGQVIAKEGADGLLGLGIIHPDYPDGLGIVKIAHGWNAQATWYVARAVLGNVGDRLAQSLCTASTKAFLVSGIVPERYLSFLEEVKTWDEWDPNKDAYDYRWAQYPMG